MLMITISVICNYFFIAAPQHLILEDLYDVYGELYEVRTQWRPLGGILRVGPANLDAVGAQYRDIPDDCLRETLSHWLKQVNPLPTWKVIVDALRNPMMEQAALAQNLEGRHCPGMFTCAMTEVYFSNPCKRLLNNLAIYVRLFAKNFYIRLSQTYGYRQHRLWKQRWIKFHSDMYVYNVHVHVYTCGGAWMGGSLHTI